MPERVLDPEALRAFRDVAQQQLDFVEDTLIPRMRTGQKLGNEPGFGLLEASADARDRYKGFHEKTWNNLQELRKCLIGAINTLNESADLSEETEDANTEGVSAYGDDLEG